MLWNKTDCAFCHAATLCNEKTKLLVNYCGSQRIRNQAKISDAFLECRANRGLNYSSMKINGTILNGRKEGLQPAFAS